ncbi:MAG: hypothetical protein P1U56_01610 [Saprospiraceae bacterium]|nr:hypothetical protein [Saprospiraceae bacterium]
MKKLLFSTAFILFTLCSYAQAPNLTVNNDSSYDIIVTANSATPTNCFDGVIGGPVTVEDGETVVITGATGEEWMYVRARTVGIPGYSVVSESQCSSSCGLNISNGLTLTWDVACYEVTITD